jgi:hypothetical protein
MANVQQWGRRESIIWPPRGYLYTLGAFFLAVAAAGLFVYLRFQFGLAPLQRYYLPYYLRSAIAGPTHSASKYQMLRVSDGVSDRRAALEVDIQPGATPPFGGPPIPLTLTPKAAFHGTYFLERENPRSYPNKTLHAWLAHWIYEDVPIYDLFKMQLLFGLAAFVLQLPFSIQKDIARIKQLRYGRRLKGPCPREREGVHQGCCGQWNRHHDERFQVAIAHSTRRREQAFPDRWRHGFRQVKHHSPNALPGRCARRQRHRL